MNGEFEPQNSAIRQPRPNAYRRWTKLSNIEQLATIEAFATVAAVRALLSTLPSSAASMAIRRVLDEQPPDEPTTGDATARENIDVIRFAVARAAARVPKATCLVQALSGWWMFKRRGMSVKLRIGVEKGLNGFSAHAWLCVGDVIVIGGQDASARFVVLERKA
jgi:hypothetical protein